MSLEDDLSKLERQVNNFSIAGAAGNFHTGFSIGDDARGYGAGVHRARIGPTPEDRIFFLEQSFKNFTIRGGHDVSVTGSLVAGGFAISAKAAPSGEGTGGGGPTPTGACCISTDCSVLTSDDCVTMGGTYQGDGAICDPNPCAGACCAEDGSCSITTEGDCVGTFQGVGTLCDPNPCECPRFTVSIHFQISSTSTFSGVSTISADFTRVSDPTTASLGGQDACTMLENWFDDSATYQCVGDMGDSTLTLDSDGYTLGRLGSDWLLSVSCAASGTICAGAAISFQPSDTLGPDPTGTHVYTLDAFSGALHFTITVTITPYP